MSKNIEEEMDIHTISSKEAEKIKSRLERLKSDEQTKITRQLELEKLTHSAKFDKTIRSLSGEARRDKEINSLRRKGSLRTPNQEKRLQSLLRLQNPNSTKK